MIYCSIVRFKWFLWVYRLVDNTKKFSEQKKISHTSGRLLMCCVPNINGLFFLCVFAESELKAFMYIST